MQELNEKSHFCLSQIRYEYPKEFIPAGHTPQSFLEFKTWQGAKNRYGDNIPTSVVSTISKELDLIEELQFADYFLRHLIKPLPGKRERLSLKLGQILLLLTKGLCFLFQLKKLFFKF